MNWLPDADLGISALTELKSLLDAELKYAYFNARRTSFGVPQDVIGLSWGRDLSHITDSSRSQSEYYNRAVVHPSVSSVEEIVHQIPPTSRAVELLIPQQTKENFTCLLNAGFRPASSLCYLVAHPATVARSETIPAPELVVTELRRDQRDYFFDLLELSGASFPPDKRLATDRFYCTEEFRCFVAVDSANQPVGWATMFVCDGIAFLANAYTLAAHRAKGVHSALLRVRLSLANQLQLSHAFTDVEPASQSHRNCERNGFRLLSVNNIWTRNR